MRVKTDARRSAIVAAAWDAFKENGFERTTMSDISARVGGSKATLYSYFKSKEELFFAALEETLQEQAEMAFGRLEGPGALRDRLVGFAFPYLKLRLDPNLLAVDRMLVAEAERSNVCELMRSQYIMPKWQRIGDVMAAAMERGELRRDDPYRAGLHFKALLGTDMIDRRLHGDDTAFTDEQVQEEVEAGVDVFLRAYAPD